LKYLCRGNLSVDAYYRLTPEECLTNIHKQKPECWTNSLVLPGLCNCGKDNSCKRLTVGKTTPAAMFDTPYTFACTNARYVRYVGHVLHRLNSSENYSSVFVMSGQFIELLGSFGSLPLLLLFSLKIFLTENKLMTTIMMMI